METKRQLVESFKKLDFPNVEIALPFSQFFGENLHEDSIGTNIWPDKVSAKEFENLFSSLVEQKKVEDVFVRIVDIDDPEEWFFSDSVFIVTKLSMEKIASELAPLKFDNIEEGWYYDFPVNMDISSKSKNVYTVMWD